VSSAALASTAIAAPYAMWLHITREVIDDWEDNRGVIAMAVSATTVLLTSALAWIATSTRWPRRAAWMCALAPVYGAVNAGLSCGAVLAWTGSGEGGAASRFVLGAVVGGIVGIAFGAPMGGAFGLVLSPLVHRFVSLRELGSQDLLERTAQMCGAWLLAFAVLAASFAVATGSSVAYAFPTALLGALLTCAAALAARRRAVWLSRVRAGSVRGWRIADLQAGEHDPGLPLFDSRHPRCDGVLVRVPDGIATYREAPSAELAVARVPRT
jgi:hypothetical protein